jgi:Bacteriocin-protection, YdeI or OmpD-Associated
LAAGAVRKSFRIPLEPDGRGSHWLNVDKTMLKNTHAKVGDTVKLSIKPSKDWPEPEVPADLKKALAADKEAGKLWEIITPMARRDWLCWIASTATPRDRARRVSVALSKLKKGMRRPCCFNRSICIVPEVSINGALLEPAS